MIHINCKVTDSKIHGIGLFTNQDIKAGDLIYTPTKLLDVDITQAEFESLTPVEQHSVQYYGYWNKKTQKWHVAFDEIRVLNHGDDNIANVTQDEDMVMVAKRDIKSGEELFQNYIEIYPNGSEHFNRIKGL